MKRLFDGSKPSREFSGKDLRQFDFSKIPNPGYGYGRGGDPITAFGGSAFFDAGGYDITPWAQRAVYRVKRNWIMPQQVGYGIRGAVGIYLVILRDGRIETPEIRKSSGLNAFDQAALNALRLSVPFSELPADLPNRDLPAYFIFHYE